MFLAARDHRVRLGLLRGWAWSGRPYPRARRASAAISSFQAVTNGAGERGAKPAPLPHGSVEGMVQLQAGCGIRGSSRRNGWRGIPKVARTTLGPGLDREGPEQRQKKKCSLKKAPCFDRLSTNGEKRQREKPSARTETVNTVPRTGGDDEAQKVGKT